jgi:hypothetical protein
MNITSDVKENDSKYFRGLKSPEELQKLEKNDENNYYKGIPIREKEAWKMMFDYKDEPMKTSKPSKVIFTFKPSKDVMAKVEERLKHKKEKVSGAEPKKKAKSQQPKSSRDKQEPVIAQGPVIDEESA